MNQEITLNDLLLGKSTIIKNKEFYPTKYYIEPFLNKMSAFTDNFIVDARIPDQITIDKKRDKDLTFNRVFIQAVLPEKYRIDFHDEVIGFVYGIDVKKPVCKIYRGHLNSACTNLTVFNPAWINVQEIIPGDPLNMNPIKDLMESQSNFAIKLKELKDTYVSRDSRKKMLGEWVDFSLRHYEDYGFGKVKLAVSTPIDAYKELFINSDSDYFIPDGIDPSLYDIYNSFTQIITDDSKDLMSKFEKTMIINKILGV